MKTTQSLALAVFAALIAITAAPAHAATDFDGARLLSQQDAKHTKSVKGTLTLDETAQQISFSGKGQQVVNVPYTGISSMFLENTVDRLHMPFSDRVQREEYLTVQYQTADGKAAYAIFHLNGRSYREVVAALEAQTKKPVEWKAD